MTKRLLLDTDVLIDFLRGQPQAVQLLEDTDCEFHVSAVSVAELYVGVRDGREREVLDLVVDGHYNKVIADRLGMSIKTVEFHRANLMQKMQAGSLSDLVRMVVAASPGKS